MVRSEKEIKEKLENKEEVRKAFGKDKLPTDYEMSILKWALEGEPRYSISDLEKLAVLFDVEEDMELYTSERGFYEGALKDLKRILRRKKAVEEILNE